VLKALGSLNGFARKLDWKFELSHESIAVVYCYTSILLLLISFGIHMMKDRINMRFLATLRIHSLANRESVCPTTNPQEKKGDLNNLWYTITPSPGSNPLSP